jgi:hypothetical protein
VSGGEEWTRVLVRELRPLGGWEWGVLVFVGEWGDESVGVSGPGACSCTLTIRFGGGGAAASEAGPDGEQLLGVRVVPRSGDGSSTGIAVPVPMTPDDALVHLAGRLQGAIREDTHGVPAVVCPGGEGHPHPANAELVAGVACWVCPRDRAARPIPHRPASLRRPGPGPGRCEAGGTAGAVVGGRRSTRRVRQP